MAASDVLAVFGCFCLFLCFGFVFFLLGFVILGYFCCLFLSFFGLKFAGFVES